MGGVTSNGAIKDTHKHFKIILIMTSHVTSVSWFFFYILSSYEAPALSLVSSPAWGEVAFTLPPFFVSPSFSLTSPASGIKHPHNFVLARACVFEFMVTCEPRTCLCARACVRACVYIMDILQNSFLGLMVSKLSGKTIVYYRNSDFEFTLIEPR